MAIMEISVVPLGTGSASVSKYVAAAVRALEGNEDVTYTLTPMGTVVEAGSVEMLFEAAARMHRAVSETPNVPRVLTSMKIDDRRDKQQAGSDKVNAVQTKL
ncbi:MAG: MTH1187 family thiamine-binding protein [candidate division KSB1 bacterium]|nr:MTH1187 family thiamine-binding protein [candidate division KSB1 bacterium]